MVNPNGLAGWEQDQRVSGHWIVPVERSGIILEVVVFKYAPRSDIKTLPTNPKPCLLRMAMDIIFILQVSMLESLGCKKVGFSCRR